MHLITPESDDQTGPARLNHFASSDLPKMMGNPRHLTFGVAGLSALFLCIALFQVGQYRCMLFMLIK
jgi:hypothetical protein